MKQNQNLKKKNSTEPQKARGYPRRQKYTVTYGKGKNADNWDLRKTFIIIPIFWLVASGLFFLFSFAPVIEFIFFC